MSEKHDPNKKKDDIKKQDRRSFLTKIAAAAGISVVGFSLPKASFAIDPITWQHPVEIITTGVCTCACACGCDCTCDCTCTCACYCTCSCTTDLQSNRFTEPFGWIGGDSKVACRDYGGSAHDENNDASAGIYGHAAGRNTAIQLTLFIPTIC